MHIMKCLNIIEHVITITCNVCYTEHNIQKNVATIARIVLQHKSYLNYQIVERFCFFLAYSFVRNTRAYRVKEKVINDNQRIGMEACAKMSHFSFRGCP